MTNASDPPPRPAPPPPRRPPPVVSGTQPPAVGPPAQPSRFPIKAGPIAGAQRVVIYGPGGIGKSNLARLAPQPVFIDIENGTRALDVSRVGGVETWADLRLCLQSDALDTCQTIVIDSITRAEELAVAHTLATVPHDKGHRVTSIEAYGFGKGPQHVYDTFLPLLSDLDRHIRAGRNVVLIAHDCINEVPNPAGDDYLRYEPHLQQPKSGKASIRERVFQWADHVLFVGYDVVAEDRKGRGGGTRTIWPVERPDHRAKSRTLTEPIPYTSAQDGTIWKRIIGDKQ